MNNQQFDEHFQKLFRSKKAIASYSISSTRLTFSIDDPSIFNVPFRLSAVDFAKNANEIEKALTWFHELTHYIQSWSTTNGILQFLISTFVNDQLRHVRERTNYKLPLSQYFDTISAINPNQRDINDQLFFSFYSGHIIQNLNYRWFTGTLVPSEPSFTNLDDAIVEMHDVFYTKNIPFIDPNYDGNGSNGKQMGIYEFPYFKNETNNPSGLFSLGTLQLMECFSKSVEFELLMNFNTEIGEEIFYNWFFNPDASDYNLPLQFFNQTIGYGRHHHKNLNWPWAHLRLFIDIALMYSDFLNIIPNAFNDRKLSTKLNSVRINPGITFYKVLCAFNQCEPLRNFEDDILRLYNDICSVLGIPNLSEMIKKLQDIIDSIVNQDYMKDSLSTPFLKVAQLLLCEKASNPLFFLNDLIFPDKYSRIKEIIENRYSVLSPKAYQERSDQATIYFDLHDEIVEQAKSNDHFTCPLSIVLERLFGKVLYSCQCYGGKTGKPHCSTCIAAPLVEAWLTNRKE